jgi:hypothetical protein
MKVKEMIEKLNGLPKELELYLLQDEFGYYYPVTDANIQNVGEDLYDENEIWDRKNVGLLDGIVIM